MTAVTAQKFLDEIPDRTGNQSYNLSEGLFISFFKNAVHGSKTHLYIVLVFEYFYITV